MCLLIATLVSSCYGDVGLGWRLESEAPVRLDLCPVYDDPNHTVLLSYPNDCRKYFACLNGEAYAHQCPDNLYWSQITYRCDYKQFSKCEIIDPLTPIEEPIQYSSFPGDCRRYQETRTLFCPENYHWNARTQQCDLPQFAGCVPTNIYPIIPTWSIPPIEPTAATPPTIVQPSVRPNYHLPIDPDYICQTSGQMKYLPYPGDCHKFIFCGPTASVHFCPTGLYWNRVTQSCDLSSVNC